MRWSDMIDLKRNIFIGGLGLAGCLYALIKITETYENLNKNKQIADRQELLRIRDDLNERFQKILDDSRIHLLSSDKLEVFTSIATRIGALLDSSIQENSDEEIEGLLLILEQTLHYQEIRESEGLTPEQRETLWMNFKFRQTNIFWDKCSPCLNSHQECCCCLEVCQERKITPCKHVLCYKDCERLFNSTISDEEYGVQETRCPCCRQVFEPELICKFCKNEADIDTHFIYCQDCDNVFHQGCLKFAHRDCPASTLLKLE